MSQFDKYSQYYDFIYKDKNYKKEVDFILRVIKKYSPILVKSVLSLGCGTIRHDILLAKKGYYILGIDRSGKMLELAKEKIKKDKITNIDLGRRDIRNLKIRKKFDFAMAMFNVIGYQIENEDMEKALRNIANSLRKNAIFVFDCWYLPAVFKKKPTNRIKKIKEDNKIIIRETAQNLNVEKNIININFKVKEVINHKIVRRIKENHPMRYWSLSELQYFLAKSGFKLVKSCNFLDLNSKISENNWNIFIIAKKK